MNNPESGLDHQSIEKAEQQKESVEIMITKRGDDFHVSLAENTGIWAAGKTPREAIGDLISAHGDTFGINIKWNKDDVLTKRYVDGETR